MAEELSNIQKWYSGRNVLVTGGTGYMGKVLLEKMLRCLPTVGKIYILVRPKRGVEPEERLEKMRILPVFERLHAENPKAFDKLVILEGDISQECLGLSEASVQKIINEVSVVFHMAATLRLEAELKDAVLINLLATKQVMELCTKMKKLESVVHVSTAFCHPEEAVLEEMVYKPTKDPYKMIELIQTESEEVLIKKKEELISPHPNSYIFTKYLTEGLVADYETLLPLTIARPSIVVPTLREPMPGWVDSLNGTVGIIVASGKGVLRSMLAEKENRADVIPVDLAINALIFLGYYRTMTKEKKIVVSNLTSPRSEFDAKWSEIIDKSRRTLREYPFEWMLWYPGGSTTTNVMLHWIIIILFQWIPAILLDMIFFLIGKERFMIRVQKKIMHGCHLLQYFSLTKWDIRTDNTMRAIDKYVVGKDKVTFQLKNFSIDIDDYLIKTVLGARRYCMKERTETLKYSKIHANVLMVLHYTCILLFWYYTSKWILQASGLNNISSYLNIKSPAK